jgi:hypothetical protein
MQHTTTISDYAVSLNQRLFLLDVMLKAFKKNKLEGFYKKDMLWHITGRISLLKYKQLLRFYFNNDFQAFWDEVDNLIAEAGGHYGIE